MLSSHITPPRKSNDGNYSQRSCKHHSDQRHPSASCFKLRVLSTPFLFPALSGRPDTSPPASHFSSSQSWVTTLLLFCRIVSTVGLLGSLDCTHFFNILTLQPESGVISWRLAISEEAHLKISYHGNLHWRLSLWRTGKCLHWIGRN